MTIIRRMRRPSARARAVGALLAGFAGMTVLGEIVARARTSVDVAVMAALVAVAAGTFAVLRRVTSSLHATVASHTELEMRLEQQQAVAHLGQFALTDVPQQDLLDEACRVVATALGADLVGVLELLPDRSAFVLRAGVGWPSELLSQPVPAGARSKGGYTLTSSRPVVMHDAQRETRFEISGLMVAQRITSGLSANISWNGGTYGVLGAHTEAQRDFSIHDVTFLEAVANVLASALRRRAAEAKAEQTHRVLEAVIEGTIDSVFVKDLDGRFIAVNAAAADALGRPREDLIGQTPHQVLPRAAADAMAEADRLTLERGTAETFEFTALLDDETHVYLTTMGPYRAQDGTVVGVFGIAHDITVRKAQELALARSEESLRLAQEGAGVGTWDVDLVTRVTTWSDGLRTLLGVELDQPAGLAQFVSLVHVDDREWVTREVEDAYARGINLEFECRIVLPDGEVRWLLARTSSLHDANGEPVRMLGVAVDITDGKLAEIAMVSAKVHSQQLETRLRQAEKLEAVGQLAGGVAHDFNNLLVAIQGYGELALRKLASGDLGVAAYIEEVLEAADRAAGLTKQLLAFGRRQVLSPELLDLNDVVRKTDGLLQRLIGDNVELVAVLAERPVLVKADRGQLEQVIMNLAVNGRDAMPGGGVLTIRVATEDVERSEGGRALLSVTDEGCGIDAAAESHIFEPFFSTKGDEGTGLGLATVHGIVTQSGGQVTLETKPGRGTTFKVHLPLCAGEISPGKAAPSSTASEGTEAILIIEDDPSVRSIVSTMLSDRGYEMTDAADGEEAIARFESSEQPIQLVVSDLMMRGLSGQQTLDRIREIEPATKALYMSGYTDDAVVRSGDLGHRTSFIQKPFTGDQLATRVRELLDGVIA